MNTWRCVVCFEEAEFLISGTSYCVDHAKRIRAAHRD